MAFPRSGSRWTAILLVVLLVFYLLFLIVARIPAAWAAWGVQQNAPGVALTGVDGTAWHGRAAGGTVTVAGQSLPLEDLRWQVRPWRLLTFSLCADLQADLARQPASATLCARPGGALSAKNITAAAPMVLIGEWLKLELAGQLSLQLQDVAVDGQQVERLQGNVSWRDARWYDGAQWVPLGAYAAELSAGESGGVAANIFDLDGPFELDLQAQLVPGREPAVQGIVAPSAQAPPQITEALRLVGEPQPDGGIRLVWPPGT